MVKILGKSKATQKIKYTVYIQVIVVAWMLNTFKYLNETLTLYCDVIPNVQWFYAHDTHSSSSQATYLTFG